ncbi:hypothetical protein [Tsukamurella hominis]|uniref:hypothetical protein n=1 Tax=Tsukamurella hominis TaxID=1970232 RepID=UPI0039E774FE
MTTRATPQSGSAVERWRAAAPDLPPLTDPAAQTAEALLLHVHYGIDWSSWIGDRRHRYWDDILPGRVLNAALRSASLDRFWSLIALKLEVNVRDDRTLEVATLLRGERPGAVLAVMRTELPALLLRVQIIAAEVGELRVAAQAQAQEGAGTGTRARKTPAPRSGAKAEASADKKSAAKKTPRSTRTARNS